MKLRQRKELQRFYGRRDEFTGTVETRSIMVTKNEVFHVMLLREIHNNGTQVADHVWIRCGNMEAQRFKRGDQLRFSAVVKTYKKKKSGGYKDYGFTDIVVMGE